MDANKNFYLRRQFILAPYQIKHIKNWKKYKLKNNLILMAHPDLDIYINGNKNIDIVLLGFIIDPFNPEIDDNEIIKNVLSNSNSVEDCIKNTINYCGRFIIFCLENNRISAFNDATSLRQLCYYNKSNDIFCASDPMIIAKELKLKKNPDIEKFVNNTRDKEYFLLYDKTLYNEVSQLIPNHYIDLNTKKMIRFYPFKKIKKQKINNVINESKNLLSNIMEAAYKRYKLALPITAGIDSRSILAIIKDKPNIYYYTLKYSWMKNNHQDIRISNKLIEMTNNNNNIISCPEKMSMSFRQLYNINTSMTHEYWGQIAEGLYNTYPQERLCIKGNASEITRCFYGPYKNSQINPDILSAIVKIKVDFLKKDLTEWYENAKDYCISTNFDITDLFYWENRMGRWQSMSQLEWDMIQEAITPYNCRPLLETMLSCNRKYRHGPKYKLHRRLIKAFWKEGLDIPINPDKYNFKFRLLYRIRNFLIKTNLIKLIILLNNKN